MQQAHFVPKSKKAIINVTITLNNCAIKKAYNGFLLLLLNRSLKLVSNPILVKANANQIRLQILQTVFDLISNFRGNQELKN